MTEKEKIQNTANTSSSPSDLKITDLRTAVVWSNYDYPILRIDTNQGVYGIGEVRDAGHRENALQFKSFQLGQNPCNIDMIFRAIKHFGNPGREGGGVSGIEIALWDLIGKVYGVPCWQLPSWWSSPGFCRSHSAVIWGTRRRRRWRGRIDGDHRRHPPGDEQIILIAPQHPISAAGALRRR